jgi:DNA helicase-2/ATP-dependent DNA helicase PcrA
MTHVNDWRIKVWRDYEQALKAADAVDFNDLIRLVVKLFAELPEVLERWQARFHYLMVDEYQDTNAGQYQLLRLLAEKHRNIAVVGDDDQSIYGFRGADISNILGFGRDYPEATTIRLEQNYRSTGNILAVANAVVAPNQNRIGKNLWTPAEAGHKVQIIACEEPREEANRVARGIQKLRRHGYTYGDIALVYRTNATSRLFEGALKDAGIAYRIVGGRKFYERREIRDVLAYLRLIVNPADDAAFLRVVNVPTRGIGAKTLQTLREEATSRGEPLLRAARARGGTGSAAAKGLGAFVAIVDEVTDAARDVEPWELVERVLKRTGYRSMLESDAAPEPPSDDEDEPTRGRPKPKAGASDALARLENLVELVRDASAFEAPPEAISPMERLRAWLDRIALAGQTDDIPVGGEVTLMTVHNAKGLEYPVVFVVHMMEGQFPHAKTEDTEVEEERRLAYVAFTRAMKRLVVTFSRTTLSQPDPDRRIPARRTPTAASRFLFGLPLDAMEGDIPVAQPASEREHRVPEEAVAPSRLRAFLSQRRGDRAEAAQRDAPDAAQTPDSYTLVDLEDPGQLCMGAKVHHPQYGIGTVQARPTASRILVTFLGQGRVSVPLAGEGLSLVRE